MAAPAAVSSWSGSFCQRNAWAETGHVYLNNSLTVLVVLGVDDDLQLHRFCLHDLLESLEVDPQVVGVEDLELAN